MDKEKKSSAFGFIPLGLSVFIAVNETYVNRYQPKVGAYHLYLCSAFGVLLAVFCVFAAVMTILDMKKKERNLGIDIGILILTAFLLWLGVTCALPYWKDVIGGSRQVTTDRYLVSRDKLTFFDEGFEVTMKIPGDKAEEYRSGKALEYDNVHNVMIYEEPVSVSYYPESKVLISLK